jgi:serine/threonine protein phosphatase PrpC
LLATQTHRPLLLPLSFSSLPPPQILATDGLWDIMDNEEAADFVERYKGRRDAHVSCAEALTLEAQERWKALHEEVRA